VADSLLASINHTISDRHDRFGAAGDSTIVIGLGPSITCSTAEQSYSDCIGAFTLRFARHRTAIAIVGVLESMARLRVSH
jgi:hypothetical protein